MSLQSINFLYLTVTDIIRTRVFTQGHYIKLKSELHYGVTHLHYLTNVPTKFQLPTPYGIGDIARTKYLLKVAMARSKVKSRLHHGIAHLHPQPMSLPSFNFLYLMDSEIHSLDNVISSSRLLGHPSRIQWVKIILALRTKMSVH